MIKPLVKFLLIKSLSLLRKFPYLFSLLKSVIPLSLKNKIRHIIYPDTTVVVESHDTLDEDLWLQIKAYEILNSRKDKRYDE